jgi:hypothetical protein
MRSRPLPERKSLGTGWNLRPDTERVVAQALRVGDVVMESFDHPFRITRLCTHADVIAHGKYIWQAEDEPSWMLNRFPTNHTLDRAVPGEY